MFKKLLVVLFFTFILVSCGKNEVEVKKDIKSPFFGNENSKVQIKIYTDFQCPACIWFENEIGKSILEDFALTNKVGLTYKMFPLSFHKNAERDALGALCASSQGKYKEFSLEIYSLEKKVDGGTVTDEARLEIAKKIGLDEALFTTCMQENHYLNKIVLDQQEGANDNITGTPSLFVNDVAIPLANDLTKESFADFINKTLK